jgi:hypothetical protein
VESTKIKTLMVNSGSSRLIEDTPVSYPKE